MKILFNTIKTNLLTLTDPKIENVLIENNQMLRMEEMNQFNFPTIFYSYDLPEWRTTYGNIRFAAVDFTLNYVIESYTSMEDSLDIDDEVTAIINKVINLSAYNNDYFMSEPWVVSQSKGENESNLMSFQINFRCNITDYTAFNRTSIILQDINADVNITDITSNWILSNGQWDDAKIWIDNEVWQD